MRYKDYGTGIGSGLNSSVLMVLVDVAGWCPSCKMYEGEIVTLSQLFLSHILHLDPSSDGC